MHTRRSRRWVHALTSGKHTRALTAEDIEHMVHSLGSIGAGHANGHFLHPLLTLAGLTAAAALTVVANNREADLSKKGSKAQGWSARIRHDKPTHAPRWTGYPEALKCW